MRRPLLGLLIFILAVGSPLNLLMATDYFVNATTGDDGNDGSSATDEGGGVGPFQTISAAIAVAMDGDTVHIAAGTYDTALGESFPLDLRDAGGSATNFCFLSSSLWNRSGGICTRAKPGRLAWPGPSNRRW